MLLKTLIKALDKSKIYDIMMLCHYIILGGGILADSNITKRALASAMKELMASVPFSKISVGDICEKCEMNRKSFYYHFRDKYDLVNWIFNSEFIMRIPSKMYSNEWDFISDICTYFYDNRAFYSKALLIEGQNSFLEYFKDVLVAILNEYMKGYFSNKENQDFYITFYTDAFVASIVRWLKDKNCMPAEQYVVLLRSCIEDLAVKIVNTLPENARE